MIKHSIRWCLLSLFLSSLGNTASAYDPRPVLGTVASNIKQYDAMSRDADHAVRWDLLGMDDTNWLNVKFLDQLSARGVKVVVISLQIRTVLPDIINGTRDANLKKVAKQMAQWQKAHPSTLLIVRTLHEMNGDWNPWGFKNSHNRNEVWYFIPAWKHVRAVMRSEFPTLPFMWCPNMIGANQPGFAAYYPGSDQVEYIGFDGYNRSVSQGGWQSIERLFYSSIVSIRSIDRSKPIVIAGTGTSEPNPQEAAKGRSKAEWFSDKRGNLGWWLRYEAPTMNVAAILYEDSPDIHSGAPVTPDKMRNDYLIYDPSLPNAAISRSAFRRAVFDLQ